MTAARLFPDYAAAPTPTERRRNRAGNLAGRTSMFAADHRNDGIPACDACGGDHDTRRCPNATAMTLDY